MMNQRRATNKDFFDFMFRSVTKNAAQTGDKDATVLRTLRDLGVAGRESVETTEPEDKKK